MDTILVVLVSGKCDYYSQLFFIIYVSSFWLFCLLLLILMFSSVFLANANVNATTNANANANA